MDDAAGFENTLHQLKAESNPQGELESFLVRRIALGMVRLRRAALMEAEFIHGTLHPEVREKNLLADIQESLGGAVVKPGEQPRVSSATVDCLTDKFQRHETAVENKLYRAINQLERLQRIRRGEFIAAPAALDVAVHGDDKALANGVKHSGSNRFEVSLVRQLNVIELNVRDSGIGFNSVEAINGHGLGLISMRERLKLVDGELSIESRPQIGTLIHASVPLNPRMKSAGA
jgi:hypothetical protein